MGLKFKELKRNEKSIIYQNDLYSVKISYLLGRYANLTSYGTSSIDDDGFEPRNAQNLEITSKTTRRTGSKRCFQDDEEILNDIYVDLTAGKKEQFATIWKKID